MNHKKPTERVVAAARSAKGSSLLDRASKSQRRRTTDISTVAGAVEEGKPFEKTGRESCIRDSVNPLDRDAFYRLKDELLAAAEDAFCTHWGPRRARLNKSLLALVRLLLGHGQFALGVRVAFSSASVAHVLRVSQRTVSRLVGKLESVPGVVSVVRIQRGERAWDGRASYVDHLEWELGSALRPLVPHLIGRGGADVPPDTVPLIPRHGAAIPPDSVPPDPSIGSINDLSLKPLAPAAPPVPRPNLEEKITPTNPLPSLLATALPSNTPHPATQPIPTATRPGFDPPPELTRLASTVIRQHRELAEHKPPRTPVAPEEVELVASALEQLEGIGSDQEKVALCARVSELAARDSAANGHERASLRFTFGGPPEAPRKFFLARVSRLREEREQRERKRGDEELVSALFGLRPPAKASPPPAQRPPPCRPAQQRPRSTGPTPNDSRLSPAETALHAARFLAALNAGNLAQAG